MKDSVRGGKDTIKNNFSQVGESHTQPTVFVLGQKKMLYHGTPSHVHQNEFFKASFSASIRRKKGTLFSCHLGSSQNDVNAPFPHPLCATRMCRAAKRSDERKKMYFSNMDYPPLFTKSTSQKLQREGKEVLFFFSI